jgi:prepilin-type processing-associated H-X9-DG protein
VALIPAVIDAPTQITVQPHGKNRTSIVYSRDFGNGSIYYVERVFETSLKSEPRLTTKTAWATDAEAGVKSSSTTVYTPYRNSNILFADGRVKPESVSKVVDENGEPLAVYHRTNSEFSTFDKTLLGTSSAWNTAYFGFYFSNRHENELESYGKKVMPVFLNIKNPYQINVKYYSDFDYDYKHFDPKNFNNNDGIIINAEKQQFSYESDKIFAAFEPNQIKSATGNAGTFGADEGNIYFQSIGARGAEALDKAEKATTILLIR